MDDEYAWVWAEERHLWWGHSRFQGQEGKLLGACLTSQHVLQRRNMVGETAKLMVICFYDLEAKADTYPQTHVRYRVQTHWGHFLPAAETGSQTMTF